jgi:predicted dehydrogenase
MRFALLGNHPDGVELARALVESGRHQLAVYTTPPIGFAGGLLLEASRVNDLEEILADPAIEAVIVASPPEQRPAHLRRALQSERHVLCVWPPDDLPDIAYEAALIQKDTNCLLFPILTEGLHPAVERLASLVETREQITPLGRLQLVEVERCETGPVLLNTGIIGLKPSFPGWDLLRRIGGEIIEVSAFASPEEVPEDEPILLAGRFDRGGLFRETLLPNQVEARFRLTLLGSKGRAEMTFPSGLPGPATLTWGPATGDRSEQTWPAWQPWPTLVEAFEFALIHPPSSSSMPDMPLAQGPSELSPTAIQTAPATPRLAATGRTTVRLSWQDAIRGLELDDAARRSIERRRSSELEYPEASEEVGFKGTMTLVGCGVLWAVILMLFLAPWVPALGVLIVVLLGGFLLLQLFRFIIPRKPSG